MLMHEQFKLSRRGSGTDLNGGSLTRRGLGSAILPPQTFLSENAHRYEE
jgi:hypothetical protein